MITYCINYFNSSEIAHEKNIESIINRISIASNKFNFEILWNNDSSSDKELFDKKMENTTGHVYYSNDIGELRGYNLLMNNASGDYIVLMQDDDIPPNYNWMDECIEIFNKYSNVGIIGLKEGGPIIHLCPCDLKEYPKAKKIGWMHTNTHAKIHYSGWLNNGPIIIKKNVLEKIGYYDENFILKGNPFSGAEVDLVVRAWLNDIHVLRYKLNIDFDRRVNGHGSKRNKESNKKRVEGITNANKYMWIKNFKYKNEIENKIKILNEQTFKEYKLIARK
tara:strand:- start:357 stop:1190 length:834 start_codon:yes stop_codon:yes gene_type:complete